MTKDEFNHVMSNSAEWIIELVCDGDHQAKIGFARDSITIEGMLKQYSYILEDEA